MGRGCRGERGFRSCRKGFTLVEIAIVLLVLAVLAAIAIRPGKNYGIEAKVGKTIEFIDSLQKAADNYLDDVGGYPSDTQQLWKNHKSVLGWYGPYVQAPGGDTSKTYFPKVPEGNSAYLECSSSSNYFRVKFTNFRQVVCQEIDKKMDDGNLSTGKVRYDSNNHYCYYYFDTQNVRCK